MVNEEVDFGDLDEDALEIEQFEAVADQLSPEEWAKLQDPEERAIDEIMKQAEREGKDLIVFWTELNALNGVRI